MIVVRTLGAMPLTALMAAERYRSPGGRRSDDKNAASLAESVAGARISHSQTTSADQPAADKAASDAASRAALRAIFARQ